MINPIAAVRAVAEPSAIIKQPGASEAAGDFRKLLESSIQRVAASQNEAHQTVGQFLSGEGGELHSMILATQRAELNFEMFLQVRNKVVQAYQEIMRMQV